MARTHRDESERDSTKTSSTYTAVPIDEHDAYKKPILGRAGLWDRVMLDTWTPEILAITISSCCLIAIIATLYIYDNKPTPTLPYNITLNAVVSILATASRSLLLYTVAASIGQLKWCWYHQSARKLHSIQTFDEASRGPFGSIKLLATLRARPLASIGAVATVLSLAYDPAVQQILAYPPRSVVDTVRPKLLRAYDPIIDPNTSPWHVSIEAGIWSSPDSFEQQPQCPTSSCSWDTYHSQGWCAKCEDAMPYAKLSNCSFAGGYPSNGTLDGTGACTVDFGRGQTYQVVAPALESCDGYDENQKPLGCIPNPLISWTAVWAVDGLFSDPNKPLPNVTYLDVTNPILVLGYVTMGLCNSTVDDDGYWSGTADGVCIKTAETCVLSVCDRELQTSVVNGVASTDTLQIDFGKMERNIAIIIDNLDWVPSVTCWSPTPASLPNVTAEAAKLTPRSTVDSFCTEFLLDTNGLTLDGYSSQGTLQEHLAGSLTCGAIEFTEFPLAQALTYTPSSPAMERFVAQNLSSVLDGVAASLSALALTYSSAVSVQGLAHKDEAFVSVTWPWLAIPGVIVCSAIALLLCAAIHSKRCQVKLWKASILPFLYHGLEPSLLAKQHELKEVSAMTKVAEGSKVRLGESSRIDRVVLTRG